MQAVNKCVLKSFKDQPEMMVAELNLGEDTEYGIVEVIEESLFGDSYIISLEDGCNVLVNELEFDTSLDYFSLQEEI